MNWLDRLAGKEQSARKAKDRLKLVLIHDRTELTPAQLDALKDDLIEVISRYIPIDRDEVRITLNAEGREQRLVADIPLHPKRKRR